MVIVVLGMHKSGTTLVSQLLHRSGIHMGDFDESVAYDEGGWFEREDFVAVNQRLLAPHLTPSLGARLERRLRPGRRAAIEANRDSVAIVRSLPGSVPADLAGEMRDLVARCQAAHPDWGFKDPRTCLTYRLWVPFLPEHRIVAVFRSYPDFVRRNRKGRNAVIPARWWRALRNWSDYNAAMAAALEETARPKLVLRYDDLMSDEKQMVRLEAFIGRPLVDARRRELHRVHTGSEGILERIMAKSMRHDPREVWGRLLRLAEDPSAAHRS
jgi:hypothetical protein